MTITNDLLKRIAFAILGLGLIGYGAWLQSGGRSELSTSPTPVANNASASTASDNATLVKIPIKDMRVGTRVPAFNPEVSSAERRTFNEPNWYQWMKLKLEMPKPDGTMLEIEMLRPEDWVIEQVTLVVEPIPVMLSGLEEVAFSEESPSQSNAPIASATDTDLSLSTGNQELSTSSPIGIPLRPIYTYLSDRLLEAAANREQALGMVVELDLPELGISGPAWIVDMEPAPLVPTGPGQVVTATFKHASANVLDLVLTNTPPTTLSAQTSALSSPSPSPSALSAPPSTLSDAPTDSIGVTANHRFWSVDRAEFVQAGELQPGERLQTLAGDINWVQQKLPRPELEPVYNLEIHDEHVYYVGTYGVLVHNECNLKRDNAALRKSLGIDGNSARAPHHLTPVEAVSTAGLIQFFRKAAKAGWKLNGYRNGYAIKASRHNYHPGYNSYVINRIRNYINGRGGVNKITQEEAKAYLDRLNDNLKSILDGSRSHINDMEW